MWTYVVHGFPEKLHLVLGHGADLHKRNTQKPRENASIKIQPKSITNPHADQHLDFV
jgi:hypothetical protein